MFGKKKEPELPAIDIRYKEVKTFFGKVKRVRTTKDEQRAMLAAIRKKYPKNKVKVISDLSDLDWIDRIEEWDAILGD